MGKFFLKYILQLIWVVILIWPMGVYAGQAQKKSTSPITIQLNKATKLMNSGKSDKAYKLLLPLEYKLAGNTEFDYRFGIAALESGHPVKASLALERVLAVKPGFVGARVDLARAYFSIGNYLKAQQEFRLVLKQPNPPPLVATVVNKYMKLIDERLIVKTTRLSGWLEIAGGYDSNVNYATEDSVIDVPALNLTSIVLSEDNVEQDDTFLRLSINMGLSHRFSPYIKSYVGLSGSKHLLADEKQFEKEDAKLRTHMEFGKNINTFRIGASAGVSTLDQEENSRQTGGNIEWRHVFNPSNIMTLFSQYDAFRYPDVTVNNFDQWMGGLSWTHSLSFLGRSLFAASAYGGYAFETDGRGNGDNSIYGLRFGYHMQPFSDISILAGVGEQFSGYKKENTVFQDKREDTQMDARLALNWVPAKNISVGGAVSYIQNESSLPIYDYKRTDVSATLKYYFF